MRFKRGQMKPDERLSGHDLVALLDERRESFPVHLGRVDPDVEQYLEPFRRLDSKRVLGRVQVNDLPAHRRDQLAFFGNERHALAHELLRENRIVHFLERDHASLQRRMELDLVHVELHELDDLAADQVRIGAEHDLHMAAAQPDDAGGAQMPQAFRVDPLIVVQRQSQPGDAGLDPRDVVLAAERLQDERRSVRNIAAPIVKPRRVLASGRRQLEPANAPTEQHVVDDADRQADRDDQPASLR